MIADLLGRIDEYRMPANMQFGYGAAGRVGAVAEKLARNKKALVLTDEGLARLGLLSPVGASLEAAGFDVEIFPQGESEPTAEQGMQAAKRAAPWSRRRQ